MTAPNRNESIKRLNYQPPDQYNLDIEAFRLADLWPRKKKEHFRRAHRIEFQQLMLVTEGSCTHTVDFSALDCPTGTVLMVAPGQAQRFDVDRAWDGWLLLFRADFLLPSEAVQAGRNLAAVAGKGAGPGPVIGPGAHQAWLGQPMQLEPTLQRLVADSIAQLHRDCQLPAQRSALQALLRHQLHALLLRLGIAWGAHEAASAGHPPSASERQRHWRFQHLLEQRFREWHQVQDYAAALGCSDKTLNRAVLAAADRTAKGMIVERIMLEAKRLLAHTSLPVAVVASHVGFDEATNFTKFFRREAALSPGAFRILHSRN